MLEYALVWKRGNPGDCIFDYWDIQARQTIKGPYEKEIPFGKENWTSVAGCGPLDLTSRLPSRCKAKNRTEGATYIYQIREVCVPIGNADLSSSYAQSVALTQKFVVTPEILFQIPVGDVLFDPVQLMIGYTEICQPSDRDDFGSLVDDVDIVINGTGDYCRSEDNIYGKGRSWRKSASEMYGEEARVGAQSGLGPGPGWGPYGPDFVKK